LFLSRPDTYDGGELVIHLPLGNEEIKLDAGEAIVYSSNSIHHVAPVTRGARLAAVTWVQSMVRDENLRGILPARDFAGYAPGARRSIGAKEFGTFAFARQELP
jgi:PKHD-type hydroxylase